MSSQPDGATRDNSRTRSGILARRSIYYDYDQFDIKDEYRGLVEAHAKYLRENEAAASDPITMPAFRQLHQVTSGMDKSQVELLLGPPFSISADAQQMANWARRHWPEIRGRADEAWGYPFGWIVYFDKCKVVDITQYRPGAPYQ